MTPDPLYLHVGLPKTGTTDLQRVLWNSRGQLAEGGVTYPGPDRGSHYHAALDLLGGDRSRYPGVWQALVDEVAVTPGTVVVSHEMLAALNRPKIRRVVGDFAARELHVVITVRDFSRIVPATWQERAKNRQLESWEDFLHGVSQGPQGGHPFWRLQDTARVLGLWSEQLPGERIHVVTVPPVQEDPLLLLKRFAGVVGFSLDDVMLPEEPANRSIGALEIAVLQEINRVSGDLSWDDYTRLIKGRVVRDVLAQRRGQRRVALPESARPWVEAEVQRTRAAVEKVGCDLVGDLLELEPRGIGPRGDHETDDPGAVSPAQVQAATAESLVALAREVDELHLLLAVETLPRRLARRVRGQAAAALRRLQVRGG